MTIAHCKEALEKLLQDKALRVIALSGEWGTGKTHLWREIKATSRDARIKQATKVSLFGVRSIADLKMRFIEEYLQNNGGAAKAIKAVKDYVPGLQAIGKILSSRFSALDEALLVLVPTVFSKRLLVLDDIERLRWLDNFGHGDKWIGLLYIPNWKEQIPCEDPDETIPLRSKPAWRLRH